MAFLLSVSPILSRHLTFQHMRIGLHEPQPEELGYLKKKYVFDARKEPGVILEGCPDGHCAWFGISKTDLA